MFALVDANNMYVSCERVFQPRLCGRPVVVLSSNDGACIARSNEAKDLGVKMAQPWFQVRHLERSAGLLAVSANFELYGDMSSRMMAVVARFAPRQEVYSIDESFLDFDGVRGDLVGIGRDLRATVLMETGLPTSVGFGPTKTLAKLANHIAKTADRKPGSYPGHLAQVCNLGHLVRGGSIAGLRRHRSRQRLGRRTEDRSTARRRRRADGARPGALRRRDPAQAVQRRPGEDGPRTPRHLLPEHGRGAGGASSRSWSRAPSARRSPMSPASSRRSASLRRARPRACVCRMAPPGPSTCSSRPARSARTIGSTVPA